MALHLAHVKLQVRQSRCLDLCAWGSLRLRVEEDTAQSNGRACSQSSHGSAKSAVPHDQELIGDACILSCIYLPGCTAIVQGKQRQDLSAQVDPRKPLVHAEFQCSQSFSTFLDSSEQRQQAYVYERGQLP